jgi:hypothetical protein
MYFLDYPGFGNNQSLDIAFLTMATLVSSQIVVNSQGPINDQALELLSVFLQLNERISAQDED